MDIVAMLRLAGVPQELHSEAVASLKKAKAATRGKTVAKWKVRLFESKKIAKLLDWEDNRLCLKHPELAEKDVAPMKNIGCNGDHLPWEETPEGGRPNENAWLNKDPNSDEYKEAVSAPRSIKYFKGNHPRSQKARAMWYHRNAGEYAVWKVGCPINTALKFNQLVGKNDKCTVKVSWCGDAWIITSVRTLWNDVTVKVPRNKMLARLLFSEPGERVTIFPGFGLKSRQGFEVDNVFCGPGNSQAWYPIDGYELKAPASWSTLPTFGV